MLYQQSLVGDSGGSAKTQSADGAVCSGGLACRDSVGIGLALVFAAF